METGISDKAVLSALGFWLPLPVLPGFEEIEGIAYGIVLN